LPWHDSPVTEPTSVKPKPTLGMMSSRRAFLVEAAARPMGFAKWTSRRSCSRRPSLYLKEAAVSARVRGNRPRNADDGEDVVHVLRIKS